MGKGRKPIVLCKGQAKISSFFVKKNELQNRQILPVLSDKNNVRVTPGVQTSPYFKKDTVKSPAKELPQEVILSEDELLASPKKEVKVMDENCDLIFVTSKSTSTVKRKLYSEDGIPDIIPATPTAKTRKFSLSCRRTKHSKIEGCSSGKKKRQDFFHIDSLDKAFNTDGTENRILSVNNPELLNTSPYKKERLNGVESVHTPESKGSKDTIVNVVGQACTEKCDYSNTSTIKNDTDYCTNAQDCTKFGNSLEGVKSHYRVTSLDLEYGNCCNTEQNVKVVSSAGCGVEVSSFEQLIDTNCNMFVGRYGVHENIMSPILGTTTVISSGVTVIPETFLENSILHNPVTTKNKVSYCSVPKDDIKQPKDAVYTCSIPEISKCETKPCTDGIEDSVRSNKTASSDILELNYDCGSVGSSNKIFGNDTLSSKDTTAETEGEGTCTALSEKNVCRQPISKSDTVNLEAECSERSVQKSDQQADVLCSRLQTAAVKQLKTHSKADSSDDIGHEDHTAWLSSDNWDFSMIEEKATGNAVLENKEELSLETFQRCEIMELRGKKKWEKIVKLRSTHSEAMTSCLLQDSWADSELEVGDIVSVKASRCETSCCSASWFINNSIGLLVLHPDMLISSTSVVGSLFCLRKGVLSEWFRGIDRDSHVMIIGSLVHELLQEVLERNIRTLSAIRDVTQELLTRSACIQMLYSANMSKEEAMKELENFVPHIANFVDMYVQDFGHEMAPQPWNERNNVEKFSGTICAIHDIEENIWAPGLGMKGKVDVTVEVKINRHKKDLTKIMPLELKTGRPSFSAEHKGQVTLYAMMMSQLGREVDSGLLLYLRDGIMQEVKAGNNEWRDLVLLRNQLAHFIMRLPTVVDSGAGFKPPHLPEPINHHSACSKCPYLTICTSFLGPDGLSNLSTSNPLAGFASSATSHLSASHVDYLVHWTGLLLLEESQTSGPISQKDVWCLNPQQRENRGKSLCSMVVTGRVIMSGDSYVHTLQKDCISFRDLRTSGLTVGDYVTVSTDAQLAVATGTVCGITHNTLTLSLNRDLRKRSSSSCFHVDIYTLQIGKGFNLTNLGCLMNNTDVATKLRKLIVDRERPTFVERLRSSILRPGRPILEPLNMCQRRAVLKALTANDYFLIKGMPGTGKTATIVSLVELLVKLGQSVLVTSHTHTAVDNVLLKLAAKNVDLLRLGSSSRIHPQLQVKSEGDLISNCVSPTQLEALYNSKPVVGTTCLGAGHPLFARRTFDVCIVDESTQVLQVSVLRPLFSAKKFILIGDPDQLPPLVRSKTARDMGMSESLFARLDSPDATVCLDVQYRMNQAITDVANGIAYNGQLKCGNEQVSNATLQLPALHMVTEELESETWLCPLLSDAMNHSVLVIDTGPIPKKLTDDSTSASVSLDRGLANGSNEKSLETGIKSNDVLTCDELSKVIKEINDEERACTNLYEAAVVQHIVAIMMKAGAEGSSIGVIAPFRAQVALLRKLVACSTGKDVEVNTVDQYQGRDKDIIIFSCTKSDYAPKKSLPAKNKENEILEDKRRLTVAITRAKHKLLIIGDVKTLHRYQPFRHLFDCLSSEQIVVLSDGSTNFEWNRLMMNMRKSIDGMCLL